MPSQTPPPQVRRLIWSNYTKVYHLMRVAERCREAIDEQLALFTCCSLQSKAYVVYDKAVAN